MVVVVTVAAAAAAASTVRAAPKSRFFAEQRVHQAATMRRNPVPQEATGTPDKRQGGKCYDGFPHAAVAVGAGSRHAKCRQQQEEQQQQRHQEQQQLEQRT